jgi:hypothetical protein
MVNLNDGTVLVTYYEEGGGSDIRSRIITVNTPEPGTLILFSAGLMALVRKK